MSLFVNRNEELQFLQERRSSKKAEFIVIYGRRRVGKSELVKQLIKEKPGIYFLPTRTTTHHQLTRFLEKVSSFVGEYPPAITSWEEGLQYVAKKLSQKEKAVLIIDEFPYLIEANKEIPSLFQLFWDEHLQKKNVLLILLGSSVGMMETEVLGSKSPLYGRRTAQIKLAPFKFKEARQFYPSLSLEKAIEFYSVAGSIPLYLLEFDERKTVLDNIATKILPKKELLHEEAFFLLKEELRDPATYQAILEAIAQKTTATDIAKKAHMDLHNIDKYLKVLSRLDIISKETPATIVKPKSRKVYYYFKDNFLDFWYRFCFPNASLLEENPALLIKQVIKPQLPAFIGKKFELICREWLWESQRKGHVPFPFTILGREWGKIPGTPPGENQYEIDICAIQPKTREILFGECKWQDNIDAQEALHQLQKKAANVLWNAGKRKEHYIIFAKSFKSRQPAEHALFIDLTDMERLYAKAKS